MRCKHCGSRISLEVGVYQYTARRFESWGGHVDPAAEMPLDSGTFHSPECLAAYLAGAVDGQGVFVSPVGATAEGGEL